MRTIVVVTVGRSDYGIYLPVLRKIEEDPDLNLRLIVSGAHLSPEFGMTANSIEEDGFRIDERVEMLLSSDTPEGIAKSMGLGAIGFAQAFARSRPDILLVLGDRFEMHSAVVAALPFNIPIAHIHGGELTEGAIDDALRHSITKMSHLHFVSTEEYRDRVIQMGEEPWRVTLSGAPSLDNLLNLPPLDGGMLEDKYGFRVEPPPLMVTFHPVTLEFQQAEAQAHELMSALDSSEMPLVFTSPNADTNGRVIGRAIQEFVANRPSAWMADNLGSQAYFSLMACASAMVGNSSSGIIEAPSVGLPVVNIGTRQNGRVRAANVIDVGNSRNEIIEGIAQATSHSFREKLKRLENPYGDGHAAGRIVDVLKQVKLDEDLLRKRFQWN